MYITVVVLMSGKIDEVEAREFDLEPGAPRDAGMVEEELERLLAPHSFTSRLVVRNVRDDAWTKTVPNYGARFDSWGLEENALEHDWDKFIALNVEHRIYADLYENDDRDEEDEEVGAPKGHPVFRASELPLDLPYGAVVTPYGLYHELWTGEDRYRPERTERLIKEHWNCLAVLCSAHV